MSIHDWRKHFMDAAVGLLILITLVFTLGATALAWGINIREATAEDRGR